VKVLDPNFGLSIYLDRSFESSGQNTTWREQRQQPLYTFSTTDNGKTTS